MTGFERQFSGRHVEIKRQPLSQIVQNKKISSQVKVIVIIVTSIYKFQAKLIHSDYGMI